MHAPMGSKVFPVMAALAHMGLETEREKITGSVAERRAAGKDLGGRRQIFTDSQIRAAVRLIEEVASCCCRAVRIAGM